MRDDGFVDVWDYKRHEPRLIAREFIEDHGMPAHCGPFHVGRALIAMIRSSKTQNEHDPKQAQPKEDV